MTLNFPSNPANGQTYEGYQYESTTGTWRYVQAYADTLPAGAFLPWAGQAAPAGWLICDGSAVSRTTYAGLFNVIGTTWGAGNGSTTFNLPDLRGRVPVGRNPNDSTFVTLGATGGEKSVTLGINEIPSHTHANYLNDPGHSHGQVITANSGGPGVRWDYRQDGSSYSYPQGINTYTSGTGMWITNVAAGGGGAHNNLQPYVVTNWIIKTSYGTTPEMSQAAQEVAASVATVNGYNARLTAAETTLSKNSHWAAKSGPDSYRNSYQSNWAKGIGQGSSLDWTSLSYAIKVNETGYYEVRGAQRGGENNYSALSLDGNRTALEGRAEGIWSHDHNGASGGGGWSESYYMGLLNAGELVCFGGATNNQVQNAGGWAGFLSIKRMT